MTTTDPFHNKNGDLSLYALNCGYIQTALCGPLVTDSLPFEAPAEVSRYRVALSGNGCSWDVEVRDNLLPYGLTAWEQFDTLTEARRAYRRAYRHYSNRPDDAPAEPRDTSPYADRPTWAL